MLPKMGRDVPYLGNRLHVSWADSQPKVSPDRPEPKHDQPIPRYKNPLGMNHTSHRLLAFYHHVEPGYLSSTTPSSFDLALWDYALQVVSTSSPSLRCRLTVQQLFRDLSHPRLVAIHLHRLALCHSRPLVI